MKIKFTNLLAILLCTLSFGAIAQTSSLKIYAGIDSYIDQGHQFKLQVLQDETVIHEATFSDFLELELDSLEAEIYRIQIFDLKNPGEFMIQKTVELKEDLETSVDLTIYYSEDRRDAVTDNWTQKTESQVSLGYFNGNWTENAPIVKDNISIGFDGHAWLALSKHFGILAGSGFNISQHYFRKDTSLFENIPFKKVFERYASINMNYELKFRFSSGNQQLDDFDASKFFIDLGARYNFPLLFNHAAMYRGSKKVVERNIHNFNDFRAFVNIGFAPVSFFMEYRLSDFIRGDNPQLPKFHAGIKWMVPY